MGPRLTPSGPARLEVGRNDPDGAARIRFPIFVSDPNDLFA
jgi:hypothetical protein